MLLQTRVYLGRIGVMHRLRVDLLLQVHLVIRVLEVRLVRILVKVG